MLNETEKAWSNTQVGTNVGPWMSRRAKCPAAPIPLAKEGISANSWGRDEEEEGKGKETQTGGSSELIAPHVNKQRKRLLQRASRWPGGKQPHTRQNKKLHNNPAPEELPPPARHTRQEGNRGAQHPALPGLLLASPPTELFFRTPPG